MAEPLVCTGTLIWYDVEFDDRPDSAILECGDCGYVVVAGSILDERHFGATVLRAVG